VVIAGLGDAYCDELERTAIGPFRLEEAGDRVVPLSEALGFLPERSLSADEAVAVRHGRRVAGAGAEDERRVRLVRGGELLAVAEPRDGELQPVIVFAPA
jgi:tRNA pseudouridine55 synthase